MSTAGPSIIAKRLAAGLTPRPDPATFAREILRRDIAAYDARQQIAGWVFFDRGVVDALALLQEVAPLSAEALRALRAAYAFHRTAFILPPWDEIYENDAERDQSFADAVAIHARLTRWYHTCGYVVREVPRAPLAERVAFVLGMLEPWTV